MAIEKTLWAISCFGQKTQKGYIELRLEDKAVQISPDEAREFAYSILEAAEAAQTDEFIMKWMDILGVTEDSRKVAILKEFRQFRDSKRRESSKG